MTTEARKLKPVRTVPGNAVRGALRRRIREFEQRYEMPTSEMRNLIVLGQHDETAEIAKWLHEANVLAHLEAKNTAGLDSAHTRRSTSAR